MRRRPRITDLSRICQLDLLALDTSLGVAQISVWVCVGKSSTAPKPLVTAWINSCLFLRAPKGSMGPWRSIPRPPRCFDDAVNEFDARPVLESRGVEFTGRFSLAAPHTTPMSRQPGLEDVSVECQVRPETHWCGQVDMNSAD